MPAQHSEKKQNIEGFWEQLRCPLCHAALLRQGGSLRCANAHCFDIAAKGYVNLLPRQKPGLYTRAFFESRSRVFAAGLYDAVAAAVARAVWSGGQCEGGTRMRILDAGCGEGSYARLLQKAFPAAVVYALDLEKEAIRLAARGAAGIRAMVGDLANIPLQPGSVDVVCNIFSPANYGEFSRVLREDGLIIKVIPGLRHMAQLRGLLGKPQEDSGEVEALLQKQCTVECREACGGTYPLDEALRAEVTAMTPLLFGLSEGSRAFPALKEITIDGVLLAGRPRRTD